MPTDAPRPELSDADLSAVVARDGETALAELARQIAAIRAEQRAYWSHVERLAGGYEYPEDSR